MSKTSKEQKRNSWIKRVIALAGDTVEIRNGRTYVNDKELQEEYVKLRKNNENMPKRTVPESHVFLMGDNRQSSYDSRMAGPIKIEDIKGSAEFIVYPFNKWGGLNQYIAE